MPHTLVINFQKRLSSLGDYGYFNEDGELFFLGRMSDYKKSVGNFNSKVKFYEIEDQVDSIEGVYECCAVEIMDVNNQLVIAVVVVPDSFDFTEEYFEKALEPKLNESQKVRGGIHFTDALPFTVNGKYKKYRVKAIAHKGYDRKMKNLIK